MSSVLCSNSVILAAAMAVSGAVIFLSLGRHKGFPATHPPECRAPNTQSRPLRPCLASGHRRRRGKKRVRFADSVKMAGGVTGSAGQYGDEVSAVDRAMPENRVALFHGILRDRVHVQRMTCST